MDGSLETIEAVRSTREAAERRRGWRFGEWIGRINTRAGMISLLFLAVVGLFAGSALDTIARQSVIISEIGERNRQIDDAAGALAASTTSYGSTLVGILTGSIPANVSTAQMAPQTTQLSAAFLALEQVAAADVAPAVMEQARDRLGRLPGLLERVQQTVTGPRRGELAPLFEEWTDAQAGLMRLADAARAAAHLRTASGVAAAGRIAQDARIVTFAGIGLGIAATILVWLIVVLMINRPMTALHQAMVRIARGDVTVQVPLTEREDQLGKMARALLVFRDNLNVMRSRAAQALEGARLANAAAHDTSRGTAALTSVLAAQLESLRAFAAALDRSTRDIGELGDEAQVARGLAGDAQLLVADAARQLQPLIEGLKAADDPERTRRLTAGIVHMALEADALAVHAIGLNSTGAEGPGHAESLAVRARALAAHSQTLALEIAEALDSLGDRLREAGVGAQQVAEVIERLQLPVSEAARMTVAIADALADSASAHGVLEERIDALAGTGAEQAAAAARLSAATVELKTLSAEMRAAVESAAAGARLGRNA